jgi:hypothetical protein
VIPLLYYALLAGRGHRLADAHKETRS